MKTLIDEINNKLRDIIDELASQKEVIEQSLSDVQEKIDSKIEEAKGYKTSVDSAKLEIKKLEDEITELEDDLDVLTDRFSNKDLNVVLETANKEINAKIASRQKEIVGQRDKISELTEKARMIKDLLTSLKNDKESKKQKLENATNAYSYYEKELTRIINFADENPDNLSIISFQEPEINTEPNEENNDFTYNKPLVDDKVVFDALETIEKENDDESNDVEQSSEDIDYNISEEEEKHPQEDNKPFIESSTSFLDSLNTLDDNADNSNASSFFEKETTSGKVDFKTLNETIDKEYEDIFGTSSKDISLESKEEQDEQSVNDFELANELNVDNSNDDFESINPFSTDFAETLNNIEFTGNAENDNSNENIEIVNFFKNNNLDFNNFSSAAKDKLRNSFNLINYTKTLDILRKNNLDLNNIYNAEDLFSMNHTELENIISKLLLAGQSTKNIGYVLNTLSLINSMDLQDVIDSYGPTIRDANITDLIIKAKHLKDLGGGNR